MKRLLSSVVLTCGAAALLALVAGSARADGPSPLPKGAPSAAPAILEAPAVAAPAVAAPAAAAPAAPVIVAHSDAGCCPAPACAEPCIKKVCVPETATRTIEKRAYGEVCEDFCVPKCSMSLPKLGHKHDECDPCPTTCETCAQCEHKVYQKKFLVVRIKKEEECYNKCNVELRLEEPKCHKAACPAEGCAGVVIQQAPAPMPPAEKIAAPKDK